MTDDRTRPDEPLKCVCGHPKTSHPFGMSEALTFNGACYLCGCRGFAAASPAIPSSAPSAGLVERLRAIVLHIQGWEDDPVELSNQRDATILEAASALEAKDRDLAACQQERDEWVKDFNTSVKLREAAERQLAEVQAAIPGAAPGQSCD